MSESLARECGLPALIARYCIRMQATPGVMTEPWGVEPGGTTWRVDLTALDPETRLTRSAVVPHWSFPDEEVEDVAEVLIEAPLLCRHLDRSADLFEWILEYPSGVFGQVQDAREQYARDQELVRQMRQLFGPAGYAELIACAPAEKS